MKRFSVSARIILVCSLMAPAWSLNLSDAPCGRGVSQEGGTEQKENLLSRINDGEEARPGEFPWMVSLQYKWGEHFCGGFLVSRRYVLTAAHCFLNGLSDVKQEYMQAVIGAHAFSNLKMYSRPIPAIMLDLESILVHPDFNLHDYSNDIALVRLEREVTWAPNVQPVCLADPEVHPEGLTGIVTGWGGTQQDGLQDYTSTVLMKAEVPILQNFQCSSWFTDSGINWRPKSTHLCAGYPGGGKDSCRGDSGGPLMILNGSNGKRTGSTVSAVGIISAGKGCGRPMLPGVYTRVSSYLDWIKDNMQQ